MASGDHSRNDKPRSDRPRSDRPYSDRPHSDRPRDERKHGDEAHRTAHTPNARLVSVSTATARIAIGRTATVHIAIALVPISRVMNGSIPSPHATISLAVYKPMEGSLPATVRGMTSHEANTRRVIVPTATNIIAARRLDQNFMAAEKTTFINKRLKRTKTEKQRAMLFKLVQRFTLRTKAIKFSCGTIAD